MKTLLDPTNTLSRGLDAIKREFQVPGSFPEPVMVAAKKASERTPSAHTDRTDKPFVTLDPASSTDLDQAFFIEKSGADLLLHYAIADVAWFVDDGDVIDAEAWKRGTTQYLPDGKSGLYPPILSEACASLLPNGPRPAVIFTVRIAPDGAVRLDAVERAIIQSRAKLAYDSVQDEDLPADFAEFAARMAAAESRRGAARVDPPEQEVSASGNGHFTLSFRPRLVSESRNAALSLATNIAVADALYAHKTGLFRVMAAPDEHAVQRLRMTAKALGLHWPDKATLPQFERTLDKGNAKVAAFMLAIRRAGKGASYEPYKPGITPWHSAVGATYAHTTAPLRRLADRYVVRAALALANGQNIPIAVTDAFAKLPEVMARADHLGGQIERSVIDLAEAIMLSGSEGTIYTAVVTDNDERGSRIQLEDFPIVARVQASGFGPGDAVRVRLALADVEKRKIFFEAIA
jgi:exoribonuclease R